MEIDPEDQDIVRLLGRLKDVHGEYPEKMFLARRRSYLKQMKEIGLGLSGGMGIRKLIKVRKLPRLSPAIGILLETALILAIVTEASAMAYLYRDKLSDLFGGLTTTSRKEEGTPPAAAPASPEVKSASPSPAIPTTIAGGPAEVTLTPTGTPVPGIVNNTPAVNQLNTTPIPDEKNGNNGHHYGQTPKPERTKEKDEKPPKEESKPAKDK